VTLHNASPIYTYPWLDDVEAFASKHLRASTWGPCRRTPWRRQRTTRCTCT